MDLSCILDNVFIYKYLIYLLNLQFCYTDWSDGTATAVLTRSRSDLTADTVFQTLSFIAT